MESAPDAPPSQPEPPTSAVSPPEHPVMLPQPEHPVMLPQPEHPVMLPQPEHPVEPPQPEHPVMPSAEVVASVEHVVSPGPYSIPVDRGATEMLADLTQRAVDGASQEGAWRTAARALALLLGAILGLRVVFDAILPTLLIMVLGGAIVVALVWVITHAVAEARRQRNLLMALAHLARMARTDPAAGERVTPQVEALIDALRTPVIPPWKRP